MHGVGPALFHLPADPIEIPFEPTCLVTVIGRCAGSIPVMISPAWVVWRARIKAEAHALSPAPVDVIRDICDDIRDSLLKSVYEISQKSGDSDSSDYIPAGFSEIGGRAGCGPYECA